MSYAKRVRPRHYLVSLKRIFLSITSPEREKRKKAVFLLDECVWPSGKNGLGNFPERRRVWVSSG